MGKIETYAIPTWLYRYRPLGARAPNGVWTTNELLFERDISALESGNIYCPTYREMNDPMEGLYRASERVEARKDYDAFVAQIRNQKLQLGIASLSETWNNELMWAHYGGEFRGICIMYSVSKLLSGLPDDCALARIAYGDKPYYLNLRAVKNEAERARAILSTKNLKWSYEREWRLFAPNSGPAQCGLDAVVCVYLGVRMDPDLRKQISNRLGAAGIEVRRTLVDGYSIKHWSRKRSAVPDS